MLRELRSEVDGASRGSFQEDGATQPMMCLLCRVLWPLVLQHRHLVPAYISEARTLICPQRPAASRSSVRRVTFRRKGCFGILENGRS
jgi:hypothetical protein